MTLDNWVCCLYIQIIDVIQQYNESNQIGSFFTLFTTTTILVGLLIRMSNNTAGRLLPIHRQRIDLCTLTK